MREEQPTAVDIKYSTEYAISNPINELYEKTIKLDKKIDDKSEVLLKNFDVRIYDFKKEYLITNRDIISDTIKFIKEIFLISLCFCFEFFLFGIITLIIMGNRDITMVIPVLMALLIVNGFYFVVIMIHIKKYDNSLKDKYNNIIKDLKKYYGEGE